MAIDKYAGEKTAPHGVNFPPKSPEPTIEELNARYIPNWGKKKSKSKTGAIPPSKNILIKTSI